MDTKLESPPLEKVEANHVETIGNVSQNKADAMEAEKAEYDSTVLGAAKAYPMACLWAFIMSFCIIMESYCLFLIGNFMALPAFTKKYGIPDNTGGFVIETSWQSALQVAGPIGALVGVFLAGPLTSAIGYRWSTIGALMALNGGIFIFFFGNSLPIFFVSQLVEGVPWGIFVANAPAYCSEIVPMRLRAPAVQMIQAFWAIGSIVVGATTYHFNTLDSSDAYRIPIALQWIFPTPLAILLFMAPESPWWLVRKGKLDRAAHSIERLGRRSLVNSRDAVAMMKRVVEMEATVKSPSYLELFRGTDLRRTAIVALIFASQNFTGNLIANQAVFFFEQAGMGTNTAFALGLITSALQLIMVIASWFLTTYVGRRKIFIYGSAFSTLMLFALGVAASVGTSTAASNAQASLGLIISIVFCLGGAPVSWVVIGETSAVRLRPLTVGFGRAMYYITNIPCIFLSSYMLNPTGGDLGGKCGYVWGGTALIVTLGAWFGLPEMKGRSYREIDVLFKRKTPARQFASTHIDAQDDE